jgi:hypothetical protein
MMIRGLGSPRIAQLALAALICTGLCACGPDDATGSGAAVSASGSTGGLTVTTGGGSGIGAPSDKSVTLSWSPPKRNSDGSSLTDLAGYTLHYGTTSQDYTGSIEITRPMQTSYVINTSTFPRGRYYFAISAYNTEQVSSSLSAEVSVALD